MVYDDMVTVYVTSTSTEAAMVKNQLTDEGIRCFVVESEQGGFAGVMSFEIKVQVAAADADRANQVLHTHSKEAAPGEDA